MGQGMLFLHAFSCYIESQLLSVTWPTALSSKPESLQRRSWADLCFLGPNFNPSGETPWSAWQLSSVFMCLEEETYTLRSGGASPQLWCAQRPEWPCHLSMSWECQRGKSGCKEAAQRRQKGSWKQSKKQKDGLHRRAHGVPPTLK